jgi:hypothetical protein
MKCTPSRQQFRTARTRAACDRDQLQDPGRSSRIGGGRCASSPVVTGCTVQSHGGAGRARRSNGDACHRRGKRKGVGVGGGGRGERGRRLGTAGGSAGGARVRKWTRSRTGGGGEDADGKQQAGRRTGSQAARPCTVCMPHSAIHSVGTSAERPAHAAPAGDAAGAVDTQEHGGITYVQGTRG